MKTTFQARRQVCRRTMLRRRGDCGVTQKVESFKRIKSNVGIGRNDWEKYLSQRLMDCYVRRPMSLLLSTKAQDVEEVKRM